MPVLMPSWAMSGQALDGADDAHLSPGVHYRILLNPVLGLPVAPLVVARARLGVRAERVKLRGDAVFTDARGRPVAPPFDVSPGNPVTVHLPPGAGACWAEVDGRAGRVGPLRPPVVRPPVVNPPILRPPFRQPPTVQPPNSGPPSARPGIALPGRPGRPVTGAPASSAPARPFRSVAAALTEDALLPGIGGRLRDVDVTIRPDLLRRFETFAIDGVVTTPYGDATVASTSTAPYQVYASHMERLVIRGSGHVRGLRWVPADDVHAREVLRIAPLPRGPGARYVGPTDGDDEGKARVLRGAPRRHGLHESPTAAAPSDAPPVNTDDEWDRVEPLRSEMRPYLDRLVDDLTAPPQELVDALAVHDQHGTEIGTSQRHCLDEILQSGVDPGFARWLGVLDVDQEPAADRTEVIAYVVTGVFRPNLELLEEHGLDATFSDGAFVESAEELAKHLPAGDPQLEKWFRGLHELDGPFLVGRVVLCATIGAPLDPPAPPLMATPSDGASSRTPPLSDWVPATPPDARREVSVALGGLMPGAGLASAVRQPASASPKSRNPEDRVGRRRLLTATLAEDAVSAASGTLAHRDVATEPASWQIAQLDWFGRWSRWSRRDVPAGVHPRPPRPTLLVSSSQPAVPDPVPAGPLAGTVRIEVAVPPPNGMAPGSHLLDRLVLEVTRGTSTVTTSHALPNPTAPAEVLVVQVTGPDLLPATSGTVHVTARWLDSTGAPSDDAEPKSATLHDPRPPAPVSLPPTLTYTSRPDVTGRARAQLQWVPSAGQARFRVFTANETTLTAKLREAAGSAEPGAPSASMAQAVLDALDAAVDAPARGAVWDANRAHLPRRWWLQVGPSPLDAPASGPITFTHAVSGALVVLTLFRVVAESAAGVETDFASAPLVPFGVPNALTPPQPAIEVVPMTDATTGQLVALVTVTVPPGPTRAHRWRMRRSSASSDPLRMPIVGEGAVPAEAAAAADAAQVFTITDDGGTLLSSGGSLSPWVEWSWCVEVQGPQLPGGGPAGEWSTTSPPASGASVPADPPPPVSSLTAVSGSTGVTVRFEHPDPLHGGTLGGYALDVYRQMPGETMRLLTSVAGEEPPPRGRPGGPTTPFTVIDAAPAPPGTRYRVVVIDPIGRTSAPSPAVAP